MSLSVDIEKKLGAFQLNIKFETENNILSILGASGCGKSMTLKCIAGIEKPDKGRIVLDGRVLFDSEKKINLTPQKRKVGYLFQQYALFPNMTVEQNIACGVREKERRAALVLQIIKTMELEGLEKKKPGQLSGGQQQRVALARILVNEPEVLLLDEPFSALDSYLRFQLEQEVQKVMKEFGKTVIFVSHDRDEVFRISDRIAIMHDGRIQKIGEKQEVFADPGTRNGAILTGCKNISRAQWVDEEHVYASDWMVELKVKNSSNDWKTADGFGGLENTRDLRGGRKLGYVGIRMHDLKIGEGENSMVCQVVNVIENPFDYTVMLRPLWSETGNGKTIGISLDKDIWKRIQTGWLTISMPPEALLLLEE